MVHIRTLIGTRVAPPLIKYSTFIYYLPLSRTHTQGIIMGTLTATNSIGWSISPLLCKYQSLHSLIASIYDH